MQAIEDNSADSRRTWRHIQGRFNHWGT